MIGTPANTIDIFSMFLNTLNYSGYFSQQEPDDELEDRISRVLAMQRQHKEQLLHEMSPLSTRRPRSAVGRLGGAERTSGGRQWGDKMSQSLLEESTHSESFEKKDVCTELSTK